MTVDGLTKNLIAGALSDVLVARGVLPPGPSSRNAFELLGAVERAQEARPGGLRSVVITLDGLDQVGDEPSRVVSELVTPLSRLMPVLVTTRNIMVDVPGAIDGNDPLGGSPTNVQRLSVVDVLTSRSSVIDLDAEEYRDSGWSSIEDFLSATLAGVSKDMRPSEIAAELSRRSVDQPPPFLLARLVADRLAVNPVDTTEPGWATGVVASVSAAIEDLVNESLGGQSDKPAIRALESLALGFGSGLPQQEWLTITNAVGLDEAPADTDDLHDALLALRHYIVEDSEQGEAVYRYAHELVREFFYARANRNQPSEITNLACAEAMVRLITEEPAVESLHAQRYISRYVARAGEPGVALIEGQARFLPDVARARLVMSIQALETGNRRSALDDAESAVRAVDTITDPDRGAIAGPAFAQLALCHQALGETVAAVEAAFRSVDEFATLAQTQAAYITEFAAAANNLATSLLDSDRPVEAVEWASQAVELESQFLDSGGANEYFVGIARNTLAHAYSMSGRDKDAVRESQASVDVLRSAVENTNTVRDRAALALSLESLGTHQAALGDYDAALANTQSAREILEPLALTDPAMQGQLSGLFNDLALRYHDVGDYDNAFETLKLVVSNNGETSEEPTPATVIKVAGALMNQAAFLNDLRRANDAFPIARQAVQLLLTISEDYPGRTRPLATALDNYANALSLQGEHAAALVTTRQSLELFRQARLGNPGVDADIARVTAHYGARLYAAGEISEAIDAAKEAVSTYRRLGATNPRHLVEAAVRLAELSVLVHESGNKRWAAALGLQAVQSAQAMRAQGRMRPETLAEILINATKSALNPPSARYYAEAAVSGLEADGIVDSIQHAIALRNLAAIRGRAGEIQAGLEAINRSITTFERIVRETNSSRERLASALSIRARLHREAKQSSFGLSDVDSALAHYGQLPELTHAEIDECGKALSTAALCVRDLGLDSAEITDRVERCLQRLDSPSDRAWMLISLIDGLPFDHPENPTWISRALTELDSEDRELRMRLGFLARSRRASIPETFDAAWLQLTGEPTPKWMQAPDDLVIAAFECVTTGANYESTTGLLTRHGLLSDTEADEILEEAYLAAPPYRSTAIRAIRSTAKQSSQQDAEDLAATFDFADDFSQKPLSEQVNILQLRKDQLQEPTIIQYLQENAQAGDTGAKKSVALIGLSRSNLEREALQAAKSAVLASGLLERIARDYEPQVLRQASFVLLGEVSSGEMSPELAAVVSFFMGVSLLDTQERENGLSMISSAAELDVERPSVLIAIRERLDGHAQFVEAAGILRKLQ
ncbi:hypothetical protein AFM11_29545 [Mycolicibacterium wolinskyi]|uniref:Tetratricopeptide repeat protein n=1 Tax=Mycolicibacterium wolinskyi TaxID=59750 RepID=A0A132PDZ3_9MYCO|nr:hypothetical protein AFM11_29545 [Mycolicibacterium wolinskyi]